MILKINELNKKSSFDFRTYANPKDELAHLFEEWVPYYQMKHAICRGINPKSILEIGVRYGYSAITFLNATPDAYYLGIDNDTNTFGGSVGAFEWAKKVTFGYNAEFIIGDSQSMDAFPGDHWDLIHIDGQQDGDGTYHDLELALQKATWILVDGYFWSSENMFAATHFMKKYSSFIEYATIIPGYAGELLIKVKEPSMDRVQSYSELSNAYDTDYFEKDCGGYASFKRTKGKILEDTRLIAAYLLAEPMRGKRILDIGCGRGELCYALANSGANVTGIDYSKAAIDIAQKTFEGVDVAGSLSFICSDALVFPWEGLYDAIIATDFVEHVEESALKCVLTKCAEHLTPNGRLIIHTAPNLQYYQMYYPLMCQKAKEAGCYLPKNPRSYYEDLMHINEQTPDSLKTQLSTLFENQIVWVTSDDDMIGSLVGGYTEEMIHASKGIFAVTSLKSLSEVAILLQLTQKPLDKKNISIELTVPSVIEDMIAGKEYHLSVRLKNNGIERFASIAPHPVHLSYHWRDELGNLTLFDGRRSPINPSLPPKIEREIDVTVLSPSKPGVYTLEITLVQELCFWFEDVVENLPYLVKYIVLEQ